VRHGHTFNVLRQGRCKVSVSCRIFRHRYPGRGDYQTEQLARHDPGREEQGGGHQETAGCVRQGRHHSLGVDGLVLALRVHVGQCVGRTRQVPEARRANVPRPGYPLGRCHPRP